MADGEAERESGLCPDLSAEIPRLEEKLHELETCLRIAGGGGEEEAVKAASDYCQRFCQTLLEYAEKWKASEDSLPLLEVYTVAIQSYSKARAYLTSQCENVALVLERLALSCVELLLCLPSELPDDHWQEFQGSIKAAHERLTENSSHELLLLYNMSQEAGVWKEPTLDKILNEQIQDPYQAEGFFLLEGPLLLEMRIKRLLKLSKVAAATSLAKLCSDHPEMSKKGHFKQLYLTCLCAASPNIKLIEEIAKVDCKDALEMICNLESEGDEKTSLILCAAFLSRQLQFGEMYCAWELTLFWSKLQRRVDPSIQMYLEICRQLSQLTKTVYHIFFLIKVIQSETEAAGLPTCIELCVRALRLESSENAKVKISICKTISCLLPDDLEVKRACQLTEFLLEPTVDAYYAVEMLYNQPDQKYDEESLPVPNSLRCELLLVLKTRWPFDPEFWDWKTLKRQCLALMGEQASIVSSIDELNDNETYDQVDDFQELTKDAELNGIDCFGDTTAVQEVNETKQKKRRIKKKKEQGYVSARFRNWQAYMQYCVLCDKEFLGHRIIRHAQKHCINGIYSCPICAKQYTVKESFVPHVALHVKQSCKERLETMGPLQKLARAPKKASASKSKSKAVIVTKQERQIKKNTLYSDDFIVFNDNDHSDENDDKDNQAESFQPTPVNEFPCPVQFCTKGFKYLKNLIAHVRGHKDSEEATRFLEIQSKKVICQYCRRQFVSLTHLNDHLQMHCGSQPYICIQMKCKASFETYADLLTHRKEHRDFRARCMFPKCGRIFSAAYMLFDHEAQHYNTFTCKYPGCGKIYRSQLQLEQHLCEHATETPMPESSKVIEATEMTNMVTSNKCDTVKEKSLSNTVKLHSGGVPNCTFTKDSSMPDTSVSSQIVDTVGSSALENALLDQLLPPPTDLLGTNMLTQDLTSIAQNVLPKPNMCAQIAFPADPRNIKLPSLTKGFQNLLNQNKLLGGGDVDIRSDTYRNAHLGFENSHLTVFRNSKNICQDNHNTDQICVASSTGIKTEAEEQINITSFNVDNKTSHLCENNLVMSGFVDDDKPENILSLSLETSNTLSNPLPQISDNLVTPLPSAPIERFKCNVEGCTRVYNSVQSIGKHMKSAHPEHYNTFKTERKNRKKLKPGTVPPSTGERPTYCILGGQATTCNPGLQPHLQSTATPSFCSQLQHLSNPVFSSHLETLVNPLLSPVESVLSQGIPKNVTEALLGTEVGSLSNTALTSQIDDLAKVLPMKFENGSDPFLPMPTENDPLPVMSSLSGSTMFSQLGGNTDHVLSGGEAANSVFLKEEPDTDSSFSKQVDAADVDPSFNLEKSSSMLSNSGDKKTSARSIRNRDKKSKHSARAKCPAIIRDGKFICSKCFRAFSNPRSLGGHLSKRTVCKPHNEYDIPGVVPQKDGQPSVLASMILSSTPKRKQKRASVQTFNPEITVQNEPFISPNQSENERDQYLLSGIAHPNVSNFSAEGNIKSSTKESPIALENTSKNQLPPYMPSDGHMPVSQQINLCNPVSPQVFPTSSSLENGPSLGNITVSRCIDGHALSEGEHLKVENGLSPNPVLNSAEENNCEPKLVSSTRVSVISGPQSSSLTTTKKKSNSSKRKKKAVETPVAVETSHELAKNILAAVGGNLQLSTELQPNFMTYGSELLENLAKHLSSADKELFLSCINESLKAGSEGHGLCPPIAKPESVPLNLPPYPPEQKETEKLDIHTRFREKSIDCKSPETTEVYSSNSHICPILPQSQATVNGSMDDIPGVMHNIVSTSTVPSPLNKMNIPICSVSPTQETSVKYDDQVLELMGLVQKLQIVDNLIPESSGPEDKCCSDIVPIMSSVIVPNPSVNLASESPEVSSQFVDKCSGKPFICHEEGCTYCAMTKDALFKHYTKVHYYTNEKLEEIKKHQLKFAPFRCVVPTCTKTFTRNSNLRAHCQSMHRFSSEQLVKLNLKRPYGRKSASDGIDISPPETPSKSPEHKKCAESSEITQMIKQESDICQEITPIKTTEPPKVEEITPSIDFPPLSTSESHCETLNQKINKGPKIKRKRKEKELKHKKAIQKDNKPAQGPTSYKPYKCVHEGCTAAFTIQQNLILHYQAVHKSETSIFSMEEDLKEEREDVGNGTLKEFRCTEMDCSRIFASFATLIQHYIKLHEMIAEEIENISSLGTGQFNCDQAQCTAVFTTCSGYIEHLEEVHDLKMKPVKLDGEEMYKCDCEACDRVYATRSNLLRHIFRKHKDKHKDHLIRPRKLGDLDIEEEKTLKEKPKVLGGIKTPKAKQSKGSNMEKDSKSKIGQVEPGPTSLKYGRHTYSLKDRDAALAECINNRTKQYPCMIRGCTSIVTTENNIIRHYKCHKLSTVFISNHRKALIVFKKRGRTKVKDASLTSSMQTAAESTKSEIKETPVEETVSHQKVNSTVLESSDESTISTSQHSENEKDEMDELTELFISKLSNEDSTSSESQARTLSVVSSDLQETSSCQSEPQRAVRILKRTNKQKHSTANRKQKLDIPDEALSGETSSTLSCEETETLIADTVEDTPAFDLSSFKPMGFEVSFLKFLEESAVKEKKVTERDCFKADTQTELQSSEKRPTLSEDEDFETDMYLLFANPSHLHNMDNLKIVLDEAFSDYIELVVKQLNELKPVVVLKKHNICCNDFASIANKQNLFLDGEAAV